MALPEVVSREEWLEARRSLLEREKAHTRTSDALNADRRRLPMVAMEKDYVFEGPDGQLGLKDLFGSSHQLIVFHVMFGPDWENPCPFCSDSIRVMYPSLFEDLRRRDTEYVLTSRAPYAKIAKAKQERGWEVPWYSSYGSDFNFDLNVSFDKTAEGVPVFNYREEAWLSGDDAPDELSGMSCFLRTDDGTVFHNYSTYARGLEGTIGVYQMLDMTPLGRQEAWEEPKGRVENPRPASPRFDS
jgi:predicted dithiol-disulfide oxidoreductase (DUF899 family)